MHDHSISHPCNPAIPFTKDPCPSAVTCTYMAIRRPYNPPKKLELPSKRSNADIATRNIIGYSQLQSEASRSRINNTCRYSVCHPYDLSQLSALSQLQPASWHPSKNGWSSFLTTPESWLRETRFARMFKQSRTYIIEAYGADHV